MWNEIFNLYVTSLATLVQKWCALVEFLANPFHSTFVFLEHPKNRIVLTDLWGDSKFFSINRF